VSPERIVEKELTIECGICCFFFVFLLTLVIKNFGGCFINRRLTFPSKFFWNFTLCRERNKLFEFLKVDPIRLAGFLIGRKCDIFFSVSIGSLGEVCRNTDVA